MSWTRFGALVTLLGMALSAPAAAQNLLQNPGFDTDLSGWTSSGTGTVTWDPTNSGAPGVSGSAWVATPEAAGETTAHIEQCVAVADPDDHLLAAKVFRAQGAPVTVFGTVVWFAEETCATFLDSTTPISLFAVGVGAWQEPSATVSPPSGAHGAVVRWRVRKEADLGSYVALIDDAVFAPEAGCIEDATTLCLNDDRFRVTVRWRNPKGQSGDGRAVPLTDDTGYFWFFNEDNVEVVLKVLDACTTPSNRFWVFAAGLTNVEVEIEVEDLETGEVQSYVNPLDRPFEPIQDTTAFDTCP
jgi:hypothetical protein